ncbi:tyrosyl-DNA phosphodiesterase 1 isoform X1 [Ricinus communis]|uniref:tyrosyl-DNA phosphodiesterase 1 isoform X1 n=1 Tax=Ricinus communis TaxID=3988 RepID=UPI0007722B1A|nr:tyrosyl-DNA phosphodiesterase 1 isoform X1 [Ricinus communis]|eukprot:XP_015574204.1 tyrosyl-DNA phosphodiesterase 1 isoform X1 [Ricinus communis]
MSYSQKIGFLVPLKLNLEEDTSIPKISLSEGPNAIGRSHVSVSDKRLSRNHLSLTTSVDGSAFLTPEGTNPVVIKSGDQRKKLSPGEKASINSGDVIELIPGHHFFKYEVLSNHNINPSSSSPNTPKRHSNNESDQPTRKKARHVASSSSKGEGECNGAKNSEEAIGKFNVNDDKLPLTFRLMKVKGLPAWANTSCVSITDVIQGDIVFAVLSNYMVDIDWLMSACPALAKVPNVLVLHGEGDGTLEHMKRTKPANWILHKPPLPISFGTHHSKAMLLVYPRGMRIIVHTANLIYVDWNNKTQGLWMQDFPWKDEKSQTKGCGFENDLVDYLNTLKWPEFTVKLPALGSFTINPSFFKKFDYSTAAVRLIASVPGYHTGPNLKKWGHMKLRSVLQECTFRKEFKNSPLAYQFSSLGSLDAKWMTELATSLSSGLSEDRTPLGLGEPRIIWPTVEDVRCSLEGYAAGNAIPSPLKNVEKDILKKYWSKWKATHSGRCRAMPHIKTFTRYNGQKLAWLLLTSANLSKAAWGALQKNNSQLMIRSYELGVLFLPSSYKNHGCRLSCTDHGARSEDEYGLLADSEEPKTELVTLMWQGPKDPSSQVIPLPVPYELPPQPYSSEGEDVPWSWDRRYSKKDVYGQVWPRLVQLYTSLDS